MRSLVASESPPFKSFSTVDRRVEAGFLLAIIVAGIAIRVSVAQLPGYRVDIDYFTDWANHLRRVPLDEFYGFASPYCDYLPGYIYILAFTAWLKGLISGTGSFVSQDFEPWIKAGPIVADLVLGLAIYRLCRRFTGPGRALLAGAFVLLNPGIIFVGAVWGQVESIAAAYYVLSLSSSLLGNPLSAAIWAGIGIVTKPHYAAFLVPVGVAFLAARIRRQRVDDPNGMSGWTGWVARTVALPITVLIGTVQLLLLPFSMSLWPQPGTEWLFHETLMSAGIDSFTSSGAFNLWGTQLAGIRKPDDAVVLLSMSYQTWGFLLLGICLVPALLLAWKRSTNLTAVLVSASFIALAFFELMTRMHERYFFLVVPLLAIGAVLRVWIIPLFLGASGLFVLNLWYIWHNYTDVHANQNLTFLASDLSVLLFLTTGASLLWLLIGRGENRDRGHDRPELWIRAAGTRNISLDGLISTLPLLASRKVALRGWILGLLLACAVVAGLWAGRATEGVDGDIQVFRMETLAYRSWQDTGAKITAGQRVDIAASGFWMHRDVGLKHYGPAGESPADSKYILPSAPKGALVGRIGDSEPFLVGENAVLTAGSSGRLQLVMNDWPTGFDNNRGRVYVTIMVSNP